MSLNFLKDLSASCSFCRSARDTSYTRPLRPSEAMLEYRTMKIGHLKTQLVISAYRVPCVLLTRVFPTSLTLKMEGALMSYQSLRVKGSTIFFLAPFLPVLRPWKNEANKGQSASKKDTKRCTTLLASLGNHLNRNQW